MAKSRKRPDNGTSSATGGEERPYDQRVALRAYELYLQRGGGDGRDIDDWLAAERELTHPQQDGRGK
jgi:hypothetical protein